MPFKSIDNSPVSQAMITAMLNSGKGLQVQLSSTVYVPPPPPIPKFWYGERGILAGGHTGAVFVYTTDYITISTTGNSADFGNLSTPWYNAGLRGCSDVTRGVFGGGSTPTIINTIQYYTIATLGTANQFGVLTQVTTEHAAFSDDVRGIFSGGGINNSGGNLNVMDYITIATTGNALDFGDLTSVRYKVAGCNDSTRGIIAGGETSPGANLQTIDYITIQTIGNALGFGSLTSDTFRNCNGTSDRTRGIFVGGYSVNIDYITIATTGNSSNFGQLGVTSAQYCIADCSNGTRGVLAGGHTGGGVSQATITYVNIQTTGNSINFGNLTRGLTNQGACSGN